MKNRPSGIWVSPSDFISFSQADQTANIKNLSREIATRRSAGEVYGFGMYLPNPDEILKNTGQDISAYRRLLYDSHLGSCIINRKSGVKSLNWSIDRKKANARVMAFVEDFFSGFSLHMDRIIGEILDAPLFGYQPFEITWVQKDGRIVPVDLVGKPQEWFIFDPENRLQFRALGTVTGVPADPLKFLLATHEATYINPYGFPLLSRCFWPVAFKKGGWKFWVQFVEKYGGAFAIGKHPRGAKADEIDALADMLSAMIQSAIAVIPDDASVEIKEAAGKQSSVDGYERLIMASNAEISKALLGQTLTTEIGKTGGAFAASDTHMQVRGEIVDADKRLVCQVFNALIRNAVLLNFDRAEAPEFIMWADEDVDSALAERDSKLAGTGQIRFKKAYWQRAYGFKAEEFEERDPGVSSPNADRAGQFSAPITGTVETATGPADPIPPEVMQKMMAVMLKPVMDAVEKGESYEQIMERLVTMFPDLNTDDLVEVLARAIFAGEVWGRLHAQAAR